MMVVVVPWVCVVFAGEFVSQGAWALWGQGRALQQLPARRRCSLRQNKRQQIKNARPAAAGAARIK